MTTTIKWIDALAEAIHDKISTFICFYLLSKKKHFKLTSIVTISINCSNCQPYQFLQAFHFRPKLFYSRRASKINFQFNERESAFRYYTECSSFCSAFKSEESEFIKRTVYTWLFHPECDLSKRCAQSDVKRKRHIHLRIVNDSIDAKYNGNMFRLQDEFVILTFHRNNSISYVLQSALRTPQMHVKYHSMQILHI